MREILFRGKRKDNGEWVCGSLLTIEDETKIVSVSRTDWKKVVLETRTVIPKTVGQYTGLTDKNGKKIFEGDIMRLCEATYPCLVYWDGICWAWKQNGKRRNIDLTREKMSIIGNIHDNPNC